jgi:hypothetical protein
LSTDPETKKKTADKEDYCKLFAGSDVSHTGHVKGFLKGQMICRLGWRKNIKVRSER